MRSTSAALLPSQLRESLKELPSTPFDWSTFDPALALRSGGRQGDANTPDLRLAALTKLLCTAPARAPELRALWNECVVTASFSLRLAPLSACRFRHLCDCRAAASTGRPAHPAVDRHARTHHARAPRCRHPGGPVRRAWRRVCSTVPCAPGAFRPMPRPPRPSGADLREFPSAAAEVTVVYLARLFAIERLSPQFCALGMIEHACEEAGVDAAAVDELRGDVAIAPAVA